MSPAKSSPASSRGGDIDSLIVGKILAQRRVARGMSQAQVADAVGTTQATISRLEEGKNERVDFLLIRRVAAVLELNVAVLEATVNSVKKLGRPLAAKLPGPRTPREDAWWSALPHIVIVGLVVALVAMLLTDE